MTTSKQWSALFLILLVVGGEARRVQDTVRLHNSVNRASKQASKAAAAESPVPIVPWALKTCGYSAETCRQNAEAEGLQIGGGGYEFAGKWKTSGCFSYSSGKFMGMAFYGYAYGGGEIHSESQLSNVAAESEQFRLEGTHECTKATYEAFGVGACRGKNENDNPSSAYNTQVDFSGSLADCQKMCTYTPACKAIEYQASSHCELHVEEPHATAGDNSHTAATFQCMKKVSSTTSDADLTGVWYYHLLGRVLFYDIERQGDTYFIKQTLHSGRNTKTMQGVLSPVGGWLQANVRQIGVNEVYGTLRVQLREGRLVSQFKFYGAEWTKEITAQREGSVMRGWLQYKDYVMCSVLRKDASEGGVGLLELYREEDLEHGCEGNLPRRPHRTLLFRSDDEVMLERHQDSDKILITGDKFYWDKSHDGDHKEKSMLFSTVKDRLSLRLMGDDSWVTMKSSRAAATSWLNALRMMQSVGVECLEKGTCLQQCTYVEMLGECSSDFCSLQANGWWSHDRPRCVPKVGAQESLKGWETLKERTLATAQEVASSQCVGSCQDKWRKVTRNLHLANELSREFTAVDEDGDEKIPEDMRSVLLKIKEEAGPLSEKAAGMLGHAFDQKRKSGRSAVAKTLKEKGCDNVADGSMEALYRLDAETGSKLSAAQAVFRTYTESCPWFKSMVSSQDVAIKEAEEAEQAIILAQKTILDSANGTNSLLQESSEIAIMEIIIITALVASAIVIATGVIMAVSGIFCSPATQTEETPSMLGRNLTEFAHKHCAKKHLQTRGSCWHNRVLPGVYTIIGGFVTLTLSGVAVYALAAAGATTVVAAGAASAAGWTLAGIGATGTTIITIVQSWMNRIKSSLSDGEELSKEQLYVQCVKTFKAGLPEQEPADAVPDATVSAPDAEEEARDEVVQVDSIKGFNDLFKTAVIRPVVSAKFRDELLSEGVVSIDELVCEDWTYFIEKITKAADDAGKSGNKLTRFESKRFLRAVCGDAAP